MKAISHGDNTYDVFDDSLKVYDKLPASQYVVRFNERRGFYLEKYTDIKTTEAKVYGVHEEKVQKVLASFGRMGRSLGVILSGDKGIGKSLFAKMLCIEAIKEGIAVVIVDRYFDGIASYIESIEQEALILFDEFDKTFCSVRQKDGEASTQAGLLSLFDGISSGKKLFVITCNELDRLSDYIVNRPGRFHYHFRFEYPSGEDIREYLQDKLAREYYCEIDNVISFSRKVRLNYDCLRAIAFELNAGISFREAIKDLNILNTDHTLCDIELIYKNGFKGYANSVYVNMFNFETRTFEIYDKCGNNFVDISFSFDDLVFNESNGYYMVMPENISKEYFEKGCADDIEMMKTIEIECAVIKVRPPKTLHYCL